MRTVPTVKLGNPRPETAEQMTALPRDRYGRFVKRQPPPVEPTFGNSWPLFAWLVATAVVGYYARNLILAVAALVLFVRGAAWFGYRFPLTTFFLLGFIRGLTGRRRRW